MSDLKLALQSHIMVGNVRFYVYLQQKFAADATRARYVADIRRDMDGIVHPELLAEFKSDLDTIGTVLTKRVQLEEMRLYTLYAA